MRRASQAVLLFLFLQAGANIQLNAQTLDDARLKLEEGKPGEARNILTSVLQFDSKNCDAHQLLGWTYLRSDGRDFDKAIEHMEAAVELDEQNAEHHYGLGVALGMTAMDANPFRQAWLAPQIKSAFEKAVELNPDHINARGGLVDFYDIAPGILGGDDDKAWEQVEAILKLDEFSGRAKKAQLLFRHEKPQEAEQELLTLTEKLPENPRGWKTLGYFYLRTQKPEKSLAPFQKYVELRPDTADSFDSLGEGLLRSKQYAQAIEILHKALSIEPEFLSSIYKLAQAYEANGQQREAKDHYLKATTLETNAERRKEIEKKLKDLH